KYSLEGLHFIAVFLFDAYVWSVDVSIKILLPSVRKIKDDLENYPVVLFVFNLNHVDSKCLFK
ncbi:hypothetical protein, partial [Aerococcus urinae]|uniref:hypothetical protein n=1 Tax=Aerococcus urinae TaxID=1376 RepID=UPI001E430349